MTFRTQLKHKEHTQQLTNDINYILVSKFKNFNNIKWIKSCVNSKFKVGKDLLSHKSNSNKIYFKKITLS